MDAIEMITNSQVCVFMTQGAGWVTASGVDFSYETPYQMMDGGEAALLIKSDPDRFRLATREEVKEFYTNKPKTGEISSEKNADDIIRG
jgi:hypothetical protein